jgi:hypothetical protein
MKKLKSIWVTITGSISAILPLFFTFCKPGGACAVACASPLASLMGISVASISLSPAFKFLYPLLLILSTISFTVSYYKLYVLPKYATANNACTTDCACGPPKKSRQYLITLYSFWIGLISSISFFTYIEFQNYIANNTAVQSSALENACCTGGGTCDSNSTEALLNVSDSISGKPCCEEGKSCE